MLICLQQEMSFPCGASILLIGSQKLYLAMNVQDFFWTLHSFVPNCQKQNRGSLGIKICNNISGTTNEISTKQNCKKDENDQNQTKNFQLRCIVRAHLKLDNAKSCRMRSGRIFGKVLNWIQSTLILFSSAFPKPYFVAPEPICLSNFCQNSGQSLKEGETSCWLLPTRNSPKMLTSICHAVSL